MCAVSRLVGLPILVGSSNTAGCGVEEAATGEKMQQLADIFILDKF